MATPKAVREFLARIGQKGGRRSRKNLGPATRRRLARKAAMARWARVKAKRKA